MGEGGELPPPLIAFDMQNFGWHRNVWWHQNFGDIKILVTSKFWWHQNCTIVGAANFDVTKSLIVGAKFWWRGVFKLLVTSKFWWADPEFVIQIQTHNSFDPDPDFMIPLSCGFKNFWKILVIWSSLFWRFWYLVSVTIFCSNTNFVNNSKMLRVRKPRQFSRKHG